MEMLCMDWCNKTEDTTQKKISYIKADFSFSQKDLSFGSYENVEWV